MNALTTAATASLPSVIKPEWLAHQRPIVVDQNLETSLAQRFNVRLIARGSWAPGEPQKTAGPSLSSSGKADLAGALALIDASHAPAPEEVLEQELAACSKLTARKAESDAGAMFQLVLYVGRLRDYPADIAVAAVRDWPDKSRWWPEWADLRAACEARMWWRRQAREAISFAMRA